MLYGKLGISLEMVPQRAHQLAHHDVIRVLLDNPQQKHTVLLQVLVQERVQYLEIHNGRGRGRRRRVVIIDEAAKTIVHLEVALNKVHARRAAKRKEPVEERIHAQRCDQTKPEPYEDENLFVEQVDGQRALDRVLLVVLAESANSEVAHCDAREAR